MDGGMHPSSDTGPVIQSQFTAHSVLQFRRKVMYDSCIFLTIHALKQALAVKHGKPTMVADDLVKAFCFWRQYLRQTYF